MATQTDVDRLHIVWQRLQVAVNKTIPRATGHLAAVKSRIKPPDDHNR